MSRAVPDPDSVIRIMRETAAREIMPRFRRLADDDVREKGPGDLVTTADLAAEVRLTAELVRLVPGSLVVGEEAAATDPGVVDALDGRAPVWVVDPLDGTRNFADGTPRFAVIVAFCVGGETVAGWIHDPVADVTLWAAAGQGAWNGREHLRTARSAPLASMRGTAGRKLRRRLGARRAAGDDGAPEPVVSYGCSGHEYMDLARGRLHFATFHGRLKPWDHAAGVLLHGEAGGFNALVERGAPYRPYPAPTDGTLLLAPDEAAWADLHRVLAEG